MHDLKYVRSTK